MCTNGRSIESLEKPAGWWIFADYADLSAKSVLGHFHQGASRVDVIFDRYCGASFIKAQTRAKRDEKTKNHLKGDR